MLDNKHQDGSTGQSLELRTVEVDLIGGKDDSAQTGQAPAASAVQASKAPAGAALRADKIPF